MLELPATTFLILVLLLVIAVAGAIWNSRAR